MPETPGRSPDFPPKAPKAPSSAWPLRSAVIRLESKFGPIFLIWDFESQTLQRVWIAQDGSAGDIGAVLAMKVSGAPELVRTAAAFIEALLSGAGRAFVFPLELIPLQQCPGFQRKILSAEHAIRPGTVSTYARLAEAAGYPGAGRAVGSALSHNPFPLLIPCHRTIRSDGSLGGYQGGLAMKRYLLEQEGISFLNNGKVDLKCVPYGI